MRLFPLTFVGAGRLRLLWTVLCCLQASAGLCNANSSTRLWSQSGSRRGILKGPPCALAAAGDCYGRKSWFARFACDYP